MLFREKQASHPPLFEAVGCVCVRDGQVLLLRRQDKRSHPRTWGLPSGKIDHEETDVSAMIRELYEETRLLQSSENLRLIGKFHVISPDVSFMYSLYRCDVSSDASVTINPTEHIEYQWIHPFDALRLDLIPDLEECLRIVLPELQPDQSQFDLFTGLPISTPEQFGALQGRVPSAVKNADFHFVRPNNKRYWVSFGPPGAGKSSTLRAMLNADRSLTLVQDHTILAKPTSNLRVYLHRAWEKSQRAFFFHFQMEVLPFRFGYTWNAPDNAIVDETIYSTLAYSRALHELRWISDNEYQTFYANYLTYHRLLHKPQQLLYFHCDVQTLLGRINKRGRKLEFHYPHEYIQALASAFEELATELSGEMEVVRINTGSTSASKLARIHAPRR